MKTGELFIEQVLIGALVLAIGISPWLGAKYGDIKAFLIQHCEVNGSIVAISGAIIVGICFLLGIIFDRFADSLMARLEQHHRLQFACKMLQNAQILELPIENLRDPFPEDHFRLVMLRENDGILDWMDYHRSRIRLSRALAIYIPGLTLAIVIGFLKSDVHPWGLIFIPALYMLASLIAQLLSCFGYKLPRTYQKEKFEEYREKYGHPNYIAKAISLDPTVVACVALLLVAFAYARYEPNFELCGITIGGMFLSGLSLWSWWRISETYREYLFKIGTRSFDNITR